MSDVSNTTGISSVNDGVAGAAMYAALSTKNGSGYDGWSDWCGFLANSVREIDRDVLDTKADIRETIHNQSLKQSGDVQALLQRMAGDTMSLHNRMCESEKAAIKAEYEAKLAIQAAIKEVNQHTTHTAEVTESHLVRETDRVGSAVAKVEAGVESFEKSVTDKLCDFDRRVTDKFTHAREEDLEEKVDELRQLLQECRCGCGASDRPGNS